MLNAHRAADLDGLIYIREMHPSKIVSLEHCCTVLSKRRDMTEERRLGGLFMGGILRKKNTTSNAICIYRYFEQEVLRKRPYLKRRWVYLYWNTLFASSVKA